MPEPRKHIKATLETIDKLIGQVNDPELLRTSSVCEETIEVVYGYDDDGIILDLLTLARIALVHLQGASFLVHEETQKPNAKPEKGV